MFAKLAVTRSFLILIQKKRIGKMFLNERPQSSRRSNAKRPN
jgi:hypothetical protein